MPSLAFPARPTLPLLAVLVLIAAALLAPAPPAAAAEPADRTDLVELEPMSAPPVTLLAAAEAREAPEDADVEVLLMEGRFRFDEAGRATVRKHTIYRVLTSAGAEQANEIAVVYAPWHQEAPSLRARVVLPGGAVHTLDPATVSETPLDRDAPRIYQDRRRRVAPLPAIQPGAVVETVTEEIDREPFFAPGTLHRMPFFFQGAPIRHARAVVDAPAGLDLRFEVDPATEALAEPLVESAEGSGDRVRHTYEARDLEPAELWLSGQPPETILYPFVAVTTGASWNGVARHYAEIVDRQLGSFEALRAALPAGTELPAAEGASQWEQIAESLAWVHEQVRYTGVELGEAAIVPRPPAATLTRRYGDCKDKATLLVALLREIGVPAYVALLRAGSPEDVLPELPGMGAGGFDHAIVYVPGSPALWIDATDPYSPLGELPTMSQGRLALVAAPGTEGLIRTPVAGADENRTAETREIFLAEYGPGRVVERGVYRGAHGRSLRSGWDLASRSDIEEALAVYAEGTYGSGEVSGIEHSPLGEPGPLELRFEVSEAEWATTDFVEGIVLVTHHDVLQNLPYLGVADDEDDDGEERTADFLVAEPHETEILYRIHVPDGFAVREVPEDEVRSFGPATLTRDFETADGELRARLTFRLAERRLSPDQLEALREEVEAFRQEDALLLWFDNVAARHLAAGRIDQAIEENRRLWRAHPSEALHTLRLAGTVREIGLYDEARRLAERAVELEPEKALAHAVLGEVLFHDAVGRQFEPGFDRDGALAALRRSHELDPDELQVTMNLAVTLEHDADGTRYAHPEGLEEAIEVYRSVEPEDLVGTGYENNLPLALLHAGRAEEALELLDDEAADAGRYALLVAAEAMVNGAEDAIARAERRMTGGREQRAAILTSAAQTLVTLRRYPEGATLMRSAARAASNEARAQQAIDLFDSLRRHEEVTFDPDEPIGRLMSLVVSILGGSDVFDELRNAMASDWYRAADEERLRAVLGESEEVIDVATAGANGMTRDALLDFSISVIEWTVEERPLLGYVVTLEPIVPGVREEERSILVREDGRLRLVGSDEKPRDYGRYAYELARDGELERARALLDHALEVTEAPDEDDTLWSASEMLHAVWPSEDPDDPEAARLAGAVLASEDLVDHELVEFLRHAEVPPEQEMARLQALASALMALDAWEELLEVAETIETSDGEDFYHRMALEHLGRFDELFARLDAKAEEATEDEPEEARRIARTRALTLMRTGRLEEALAAYVALFEEEDDQPRYTYNQAAWLTAVLDRVDDRSLDWAQRATEKGGASDQARLHTLATVLAERGQTLQAYQTLLRAIAANPDGLPASHDWYVLGRIAEHHDFREAAREYYERVEAPDEPNPTSTHRIAQRRLRALLGSGGSNGPGGSGDL